MRSGVTANGPTDSLGDNESELKLDSDDDYTAL